MTIEELWLERVTAWRASELSAPEFCADKEFEAGSLRAWSSRLGREGKASRARVGRRPKGRDAPSLPSVGVRLARAVVEPSSSIERAAPSMVRVPASGAVMIGIGEARIEVVPGFDPSLLRAVVEALGRSSR